MKILTANNALSQLVIIDMQLKLASAMQADAMQTVQKNISVLVQSAKLLEVSVIVTEQYPQGLGATIPEIMLNLPQEKPIAKTMFSASKVLAFNQLCVRDKPQLVLTGMEAHICILQTAIDLAQTGKQVFVVEDAIISRNPANKANAIARMRDAGCIITNTESMVFEWLGKAEGDVFKAIAKLIR